MNIVEAYRKAVEIGATKIYSKHIPNLIAFVKHSNHDTRLITTLGSDCILANSWLTANDFEVEMPKVDFMRAWKHMENGKTAKFRDNIYTLDCAALTCITFSRQNAILFKHLVNEKEWELL